MSEQDKAAGFEACRKLVLTLLSRVPVMTAHAVRDLGNPFAGLRNAHNPNADPWCSQCGHAESDHPRGEHCGAATEEGCDCPRFRPEPQGAPSGWCDAPLCENHVSGPGLLRCWEHGWEERARGAKGGASCGRCPCPVSTLNPGCECQCHDDVH